jgi:NADH:ubiquinone oxidoreductase subunit K
MIPLSHYLVLGAILVVLFRNRNTINVEDLDKLKG